MAKIKIKLDLEVSVSASKSPSGYATYAGNGAQNLVIDSKHKAAVTKVLSNVTKAKKLGLECAKAGKALDAAKMKLRSAKTEATKTNLKSQIKTLTATAKSTGAEAKQLLRDASASLKNEGLSGLELPVLVSYITVGDWKYTAGKIKNVKTDRFRVKTHGSTTEALKPKFGATSVVAKKRDAEVDRKKGVKPGSKIVSRVKTAEEQFDKPFRKLFLNATTTEFGKKYARDYWNYRRVGNKIVMDNPGQSMAATITSAMAQKQGMTIDQVERHMKSLRMTEAKKPKRVARKPRTLTHYND